MSSIANYIGEFSPWLALAFVVVFWPLLVTWSLNTLGATIPYEFTSWLAVQLIQLTVAATKSSKEAK